MTKEETESGPKYPDIYVQLTGHDSNAFGIIGRVMKDGGVPKTVCDAFCNEAMSGDYDHMLRTAASYVDVG